MTDFTGHEQAKMRPADADGFREAWDTLERLWQQTVARARGMDSELLRERLGDPRRIPSALVALGEAELAAGNFPHALDLLRRAVPLAHEAGLLPWRIADAEQNLREAEAAARA